MYGLNIKISGHVQGVGCRWLLQQYAKTHNLTGWVKNLIDGRVEAELYSEAKDKLEKFIDWLKNDSGFTIINIEKTWLEGSSKVEGFEIRVD